MRFKIGFEKADLKRLHQYWDRIIENNQWTEGEFTRMFEEKWSAYNNCESVAFSGWTGTALAALEFFKVKGKTVLCPSNTFMATPLVTIKAGASVEFVDAKMRKKMGKINRSIVVKRADWNMNFSKLEKMYNFLLENTRNI